jgi:hypothetical protein
MNLKPALRNLLLASTAVTSRCALFDFGGVTQAAIFTGQVFPERTEYPAIIISQVSTSWGGVRGYRGGEVFVDVNVYGDKLHSDTALSDLASAVWDAIDRQSIEVGEYKSYGMFADPPVEQADVDGFNGYVIRLRIIMVAE